jgi:Family of unknown function (DUF695)
MSFLKKLFPPKNTPINSNKDFWDWFLAYEKNFFKVVKDNDDIHKNFFDKIGPKLDELNDGYFYLTGMVDDNTVELILTAEGRIKNIILVEELVKAAPKVGGWLFTALKPAIEKDDASIQMYDYEFHVDNLYFYSTENIQTPDEIEITVVHPNCTKENEEEITHGVNVFLDNFLGELNFATKIDSLNVIGTSDAETELIPMQKLKDYLIWREKEFIEKYEAVRHNTENDNYSMMQGELENGNRVFSLFNTDLLQWDAKASHPWITSIELKFDGSSNNGMPDDKMFKLLDKIEEEIGEELKDIDGYLNVGRETTDGTREIFFACAAFRKPSLVISKFEKKYINKVDISFEIYKDKYWKTFERFQDALANGEDVEDIEDDDEDE